MPISESSVSRSLKAWLDFGEEYLTQKGIPDPKTDAWMLLEYAANLTRSYYFLHRNEPMDEKDAEDYFALLKKRGTHVPVQYITGEAWFYGNSFKVTPAVLIPRQDTEILVEEAEKRINPGMRILDMCTGSGCILLSLLKKRSITGVGADKSEEALAVAKENADRLGVKAGWILTDLFENVGGTFDMILTNPPYIATGVIPTLDPEVKDHEPLMALDGREDGLFFEKKIALEARQYLNRGGYLLAEIGYDQGPALCAYMDSLGYSETQIVKDLAGNDRVVIGRMSS